MKVIVDTCVWSGALRKQSNETSHSDQLFERLIENDQVIMLGPIRQELLSGIKDNNKFEELKTRLSWFGDLSINTADYELAASLFNKAQSRGVQGSHIDFLICAVAIANDLSIYTYDKDFFRFSGIFPIKLVQ